MAILSKKKLASYLILSLLYFPFVDANSCSHSLRKDDCLKNQNQMDPDLGLSPEEEQRTTTDSGEADTPETWASVSWEKNHKLLEQHRGLCTVANNEKKDAVSESLWNDCIREIDNTAKKCSSSVAKNLDTKTMVTIGGIGSLTKGNNSAEHTRAIADVTGLAALTTGGYSFRCHRAMKTCKSTCHEALKSVIKRKTGIACSEENMRDAIDDALQDTDKEDGSKAMEESSADLFVKIEGKKCKCGAKEGSIETIHRLGQEQKPEWNGKPHRNVKLEEAVREITGENANYESKCESPKNKKFLEATKSLATESGVSSLGFYAISEAMEEDDKKESVNRSGGVTDMDKSSSRIQTLTSLNNEKSDGGDKLIGSGTAEQNNPYSTDEGGLDGDTETIPASLAATGGGGPTGIGGGGGGALPSSASVGGGSSPATSGYKKKGSPYTRANYWARGGGGSKSLSGSGGYRNYESNAHLGRGRSLNKVAKLDKNKVIDRKIASSFPKERSIFDKATKVIKNYCKKDKLCN